MKKSNKFLDAVTPIRILLTSIGVAIMWLRTIRVQRKVIDYSDRKVQAFRVTFGLPHAIPITKLIYLRSLFLVQHSWRKIKRCLRCAFYCWASVFGSKSPLTLILSNIIYFLIGSLIAWSIYFFVEFQFKPRFITQLISSKSLFLRCKGHRFLFRPIFAPKSQCIWCSVSEWRSARLFVVSYFWPYRKC